MRGDLRRCPGHVSKQGPSRVFVSEVEGVDERTFETESVPQLSTPDSLREDKTPGTSPVPLKDKVVVLVQTTT